MTVTAYIKLSNRCPIGCTHCYLSEEVRADHGVMTPDTMKRTAAFLAEMTANGGHELNVIWHGGEPLILGPEIYMRMGSILDDYVATHTQNMQTSLIPYSSKFAPLVHSRFGGFIGSSVDFTQRTIKGSPQRYMDLWLDKVAQARADGITVIPGMVPGKAEIPRAREIVEWFISQGFAVFNVERYNAFGMRPLDWPSNLAHSHFLIDLFEEVIVRRFAQGSFTPYVRVLAAAIGGVLYNRPGDRWGGSCQSDFVVIEPDGSLNNCPDKSSYEKAYGNVTNGFDAFASSPERRKSIRIQVVGHKRSHCEDCENNSWCKSGCPIALNGPPDGQEECSGYKTFLNHVRAYTATDKGFTTANAYLNMNPFQQREAA
jgi:radical SAM protein with 4Fe4S-binding SPASM domain